VKPVVLVVEDEPPLQKLLAYNLEAAGFAVVQAFDGEEAQTLIDERPPDLVLLDWMLPQLSGLELCRRLRRRPGTAHLPIIMLTARGEEPDRLRGLDTGADDFITKPFSPAELIARVRAVLRRVRPAFAEQLLSFHDLRMDLAAHRVHRGEREVHLSPTEFRLLRHFLEHPGRVFSRAQLLDRVWGSDLEIELRTVDATIRRLRRALNAGGEADLLRTVRAEGYSLDHKFAGAAGSVATAKQDGTSPAARVGIPTARQRRAGKKRTGKPGRGMAEAVVPDELWAVVAPLLPSKP
jgi:two-component system, OmpR family, phosphate regulon response regulator PhoB